MKFAELKKVYPKEVVILNGCTEKEVVLKIVQKIRILNDMAKKLKNQQNYANAIITEIEAKSSYLIFILCPGTSGYK